MCVDIASTNKNIRVEKLSITRNRNFQTKKMKLIITFTLLTLMIVSGSTQEEPVTEAINSTDNDIKPKASENSPDSNGGNDSDARKPQRPSQCPTFVRFFGIDRNNGGGLSFDRGNFGNRIPSYPWNPNNNDFFNYPPTFGGRRYWPPYYGRRSNGGGNRGSGPTFDIPDRGDIEFV